MWLEHGPTGRALSRKWRKGLVSHTAMILITAIGYPFAPYMNLGPVVDAFIVAMMAAYGSSILAKVSQFRS